MENDEQMECMAPMAPMPTWRTAPCQFRAVALMHAVQMHCAGNTSDCFDAGVVLEAALAFEKYLRGEDGTR